MVTLSTSGFFLGNFFPPEGNNLGNSDNSRLFKLQGKESYFGKKPSNLNGDKEIVLML